MSRSSNVLFWVLCLAVGILTLRVFPLGLQVAFAPLSRQFSAPAILWTHILAASTALVVMPFQFWPGLRDRRPAIHRWTGRAYVVAVLLGGLAGLSMSTRAMTGPVAGAGFFLLALLWLATTGMALYHAIRREIPAHRRWMRRSAALTFAAVTLRLMLPLSMVAGLPLAPSYTVIAWACWLPNLIVMEWWLRRPAAAYS